MGSESAAEKEEKGKSLRERGRGLGAIGRKREIRDVGGRKEGNVNIV